MIEETIKRLAVAEFGTVDGVEVEHVVAVVEAELLTETEEVAFLDADTPVQVVVAPFAARKSKTHGYGECPVVAGVHGRDVLSVFARNVDVCVRKKVLAAQEPFGFLHLEVRDCFALVEQKELADGRFARLNMNPVQKVVGPLVVFSVVLGIVKRVADVVADGVNLERTGGVLCQGGKGNKH